ncbi:MAG: FixH family protein [Pseudomonadota bacterium]
MNIRRLALPGVFLLAVISCTGQEQPGASAKLQQAGSFFLSMDTDPRPPEVGGSAGVTVTVRQNNQPAADCHVKFRQYMPGMEMSSDKIWFDMAQKGATGVYQARSGEFSMGGDWVLEVALDCGGKTQTANFNYHLEWPQ